MNVKKKLLAMILAIVMLLSLIPTAFATQTENEEEKAETEVSGETTGDWADEFTSVDSTTYSGGFRYSVPLGNVDQEEVEKELEEIAAKGFNVIELTANGYPTGTITSGEHAGENYAAVYGMGTDAWSDLIQIILRKANELGLRVDYHVSLSNGSNKHVPGVSPNDDSASKELVYESTAVTSSTLPSLSEVTPAQKTYTDNVTGNTEILEQNLYAVLLVNVVETDRAVETLTQKDGTISANGMWGVETFTANYDVIDYNKTIDVTAIYDDSASQEEKDAAQTQVDAADYTQGEWQLMAFWWRGDCVTVSGVTKYPSYRINYFSKTGSDALMDYYEENIFRFDQTGYEDMRNLINANGGNIFADSYGANANWTMELPEKFEELTGESIATYLPAMFYADSSRNPIGFMFTDDSEVGFLEDYRQAMTDLLCENQLEYLQERCNAIGLQYRDQVVYATSRLDMIQAAAYTEIPEVESLNQADSIDYYTAMSSAAHFLGKDIVSSEHSATYGDTVGAYALPITMSIDQANRAFAGGINQLILHVYAYGYLDDQVNTTNNNALWPGLTMFGNFSESWKYTNTQWEQIDVLADYASRTGYVMRSGTVKRDVAVYKQSYWWPRHVDSLWRDTALSDAGYTYDFVSTGLLDFDEAYVSNGVLAPDTAAYKAFVFDATDEKDCQDVDNELITLTAIEKFVEYNEAGLPIVMVGTYPTGLQGIVSEENQARFEEALTKLMASDTVVLVQTKADVPDALKSLSISPDAENEESIRLMSYHTESDDVSYYYLYNRSNNYVKGISKNFTNSITKYDGYELTDGYTVKTQVALKGTGNPYLLDAYSGEVTPIADYEIDEQGRIVIEVELEVNDTTIIAIDTSSNTNNYGTVESNTAELVYVDGETALKATQTGDYTAQLSSGKQIEATVTSTPLASIGTWSLEIDSYTNKNDINLMGKAATEHKISTISGIELTELKGWDQLGTMSVTVTEEDGTSATKDVDLSTISGTATYTTTLNVQNLGENDGLYLDVGDSYDVYKVYVNDVLLPNQNAINQVVDLGGYLVEGDNDLRIDTVTTLSNALSTARPTYYNKINSYGLREDVSLTSYSTVKLDIVEYEIAASANEGGSIEASTRAQEGMDAEISVKANDGYKLVAILVDGITANISGIENDVFTIENVQKDMTLRALFVKNDVDFADQFTDVLKQDTDGNDMWYYEAINMLTGLDIIEGTTSTTYEPEKALTRAEFTKLLYELAETLGVEVKTTDSIPFTDMPKVENYWATGYIGWAYENEIVDGYDGINFGPEDYISRQDMALMMQRFFKEYLGYDLPGDITIDFSDKESIDEYAMGAVEYAVRTRLMEGHDDGTFGPKDNTRRSEAAEVFYNYLIYTN